MAELTLPFSSDSKLRGAKFANGSGLQCPTGSKYTTDEALGALERVTNNVLLEGFQDYSTPNFPLSGMPVRQATFQQMSINSRVVQHVFYPKTQKTKFYNPNPSLVNYDLTRELIDACGGNVATAQMIANSNSIGCAPPRFERGIAGKDRYYQSSVTSGYELGPFCITEYLELENFEATLEAYKRAAISAAGMSMEYEKVRKFVEMSRMNGSAVAGTIDPRFSSGQYNEFPTSSGSLEWILRSIDLGIGGEVAMDVDIVVSVSAQLRKFWINQYNAQHGAHIQETLGSVAQNVKDYIVSFEQGDDFVMRSLRTNRRVIFRIDKMPLYVQVEATGTNLAQWDFQDYYLMQPGNDTQSGQAAGFRQSFNPHYGDGAQYCDGVDARLCEQILIHTERAFHYEAFPNNPLGAGINGVNTNLNNIWNGTDIKWYTGVEVQAYWLNEMNSAFAGTGMPVFNNLQNTWFAGRLTFGMQFIEDRPLEMMSLLVRVPTDISPLAESQTLIECGRPAAITMTAAPTNAAPEFCTPIPGGVAPDTEGAGLMWSPVKLSYELPASGTANAIVTLQRTGGTNGTLTVPFTTTNDTATQGVQFTLANGNVVFADGDDTAELTIVLNATARGNTDPCFVAATINWTDATKLNTGAVTATKLCLKLYEASSAYDPTACAPDADCGSCDPTA